MAWRCEGRWRVCYQSRPGTSGPSTQVVCSQAKSREADDSLVRFALPLVSAERSVNCVGCHFQFAIIIERKRKRPASLADLPCFIIVRAKPCKQGHQIHHVGCDWNV